MSDGLLWHRIQFAFTVTYRYLFPQLTMGLSLLIVIFKALALRKGGERYNEVARFWTRIFALNFALGVVTGIPLEFQFGTNWSRFSRYAGEVVGQTLAIEGVFAFVLESAFLGLFLLGERRLGQLGHLAVAVALFVGSWLSAAVESVWFAIVTMMLAVYAVLDGFDFGVGALHRLVARTDLERRTVFAAIGPFWDGNEVWLVAAGGVLFMTFPRLYSAAFSGFYMPLMIVLWLLIFRGVSIEFRSHAEDPLVRE